MAVAGEGPQRATLGGRWPSAGPLVTSARQERTAPVGFRRGPLSFRRGIVATLALVVTGAVAGTLVGCSSTSSPSASTSTTTTTVPKAPAQALDFTFTVPATSWSQVQSYLTTAPGQNNAEQLFTSFLCESGHGIISQYSPAVPVLVTQTATAVTFRVTLTARQDAQALATMRSPSSGCAGNGITTVEQDYKFYARAAEITREIRFLTQISSSSLNPTTTTTSTVPTPAGKAVLPSP
jgi:hypothetical protein